MPVSPYYLSNNPAVPASCVAIIYQIVSDKDAHTISNETHNVLMCATEDCADWCCKAK